MVWSPAPGMPVDVLRSSSWIAHSMVAARNCVIDRQLGGDPHARQIFSTTRRGWMNLLLPDANNDDALVDECSMARNHALEVYRNALMITARFVGRWCCASRGIDERSRSDRVLRIVRQGDSCREHGGHARQ